MLDQRVKRLAAGGSGLLLSLCPCTYPADLLLSCAEADRASMDAKWGQESLEAARHAVGPLKKDKDDLVAPVADARYHAFTKITAVRWDGRGVCWGV